MPESRAGRNRISHNSSKLQFEPIAFRTCSGPEAPNSSGAVAGVADPGFPGACFLATAVSDRGYNEARRDYIVDPLADLDLAPLCAVLAQKEIVLHGADYDLRLLRRSLNFAACRIFDTLIAARLLGIREFSLAALPPIEAMEKLIENLEATKTNAELLLSGLR